jgi:hypothetical protein
LKDRIVFRPDFDDVLVRVPILVARSGRMVDSMCESRTESSLLLVKTNTRRKLAGGVVLLLLLAEFRLSLSLFSSASEFDESDEIDEVDESDESDVLSESDSEEDDHDDDDDDDELAESVPDRDLLLADRGAVLKPIFSSRSCKRYNGLSPPLPTGIATSRRLTGSSMLSDCTSSVSGVSSVPSGLDLGLLVAPETATRVGLRSLNAASFPRSRVIVALRIIFCVCLCS